MSESDNNQLVQSPTNDKDALKKKITDKYELIKAIWIIGWLSGISVILIGVGLLLQYSDMNTAESVLICVATSVVGLGILFIGMWGLARLNDRAVSQIPV